MSRRAITGAIGAGLLVVLVVAWYFGLYAPRTRAIRHTSGQLAAAEAQAAQLRAQLARLRGALANLPALSEELDRLQAAVPASPDLADFILEVNSASTASGVTFLSISPSTPTSPATGAPGAAPPQIALTLVVEGGYFQVLDFLDRLATLPRLVVIDGVTISSATASSGTAGAAGSPSAAASPQSPELRVSLSARIFLTKLPAGLSPTGGGPSARGTGGSAS